MISKSFTGIILFLFSITFAEASIGAESDISQTKPTSSAVLSFNDFEFVHRWSKDGQNEYTPKGDEDLSRWHNMLTINTHETVTDTMGLDNLTNLVVENYMKFGEMADAYARVSPATNIRENYVSFVLRQESVIELAFTRFLIYDGIGYVVTFSHREYGDAADQKLSKWLDGQTADYKEVLMNWSEIPSLLSLRLLPQSK